MFAHSVEGQPQRHWEPLSDHLSGVGTTAAAFAAQFGGSTLALAMGLLHDIGKTSAAYQNYIRQPREEGGTRGPDHSTAGAIEARNLYGALALNFANLLAFGIAGHHGGLMDGAGHEGSTLATRLDKIVEPYAGWEAHVSGLPTLDDIRRGIPPLCPNAIGDGFHMSFLVRMLFSCLVDADFLETEAFYAHARGDEPPARGGVLQQAHLDQVRHFLASHRKDDTEVNRLRSAILDHANGKASLPPGLFTLTVPTGGGKTLTSLSFALEHAMAHDLRRIIYVIPFTSIIEQTAKVFREDVKLGDAVLEHHSSFDWDRQPPGTGNDEESEGVDGLAKLRRDAENWAAPIVVTTAVQFFESLFAARTSQARKLHNLAKSVIILDEVQSLPVKLLRPCLAAIDELARNYGATVILCTATQPALRQQDQALPKTPAGKDDGLDICETRELAPDPRALYEKLRRVRVEWQQEPVADEEIAARFARQPQMLCIVNSRAHARDLFSLLREQRQDGVVHMTTLMCARHRQQVLEKVRADLKAELPVRLVATSLIEAGVDVSFPEVWRAATGLASVAQAAGRCNRSGELGDLGATYGRAVVFTPADHKVPPMIESFYGPAREVLRSGLDDMLGLDAIAAYYKALYFQQGHAALDRCAVNGSPSIMQAIRDTARRLEFPFKQIAEVFRLIDDLMHPVIVPFDDEARAAIEELRNAPFPPAGIQRKLQQFVVPIPAKLRASMLATGALETIRSKEYGDRFLALVNEQIYDGASGLRLDDPAWRSAESNIVG